MLSIHLSAKMAIREERETNSCVGKSCKIPFLIQFSISSILSEEPITDTCIEMGYRAWGQMKFTVLSWEGNLNLSHHINS